jgi:hypothetical protein
VSQCQHDVNNHIVDREAEIDMISGARGLGGLSSVFLKA